MGTFFRLILSGKISPKEKLLKTCLWSPWEADFPFYKSVTYNVDIILSRKKAKKKGVGGPQKVFKRGGWASNPSFRQIACCKNNNPRFDANSWIVASKLHKAHFFSYRDKTNFIVTLLSSTGCFIIPYWHKEKGHALVFGKGLWNGRYMERDEKFVIKQMIITIKSKNQIKHIINI